MKIEIKNISLKSIILSAFPLLVFAWFFVSNMLQISSLSELSLIMKILQIILWTLTNTIAFMCCAVVAAFIYNLFCSFGIRGLTFTVEEPTTKEEVKEENN